MTNKFSVLSTAFLSREQTFSMQMEWRENFRVFKIRCIPPLPLHWFIYFGLRLVDGKANEWKSDGKLSKMVQWIWISFSMQNELLNNWMHSFEKVLWKFTDWIGSNLSWFYDMHDFHLIPLKRFSNVNICWTKIINNWAISTRKCMCLLNLHVIA